MPQGSSIIVISDEFAGQITPIDITQTFGTIRGWFPERVTLLWSINLPNYHFQIRIEDKTVIVERNKSIASVTRKPPFGKKGLYYLCATWSPTSISVYVGEGESSGHKANDGFAETHIQTEPTIPPPSLLTELKKLNLIPMVQYPSIESLRVRVYNAIQIIDQKLKQCGVSAFWNITYNGKNIEKRIPKKETDIHPTIHALLDDVMTVGNISVHPEAKNGVGNLDFLFEAPLVGHTMGRIAAEFKLAHSKDLISGFETQLPNYMSNIGADFGAYCVLWFKGDWFGNPQGIEKPNGVIDLLYEKAEKMPLGRRIRPFVINCTKSQSATGQN